MHIYTQLKLNAANAIFNINPTFDSFEEITERKPIAWRNFVQKHKSEFDY